MWKIRGGDVVKRGWQSKRREILKVEAKCILSEGLINLVLLCCVSTGGMRARGKNSWEMNSGFAFVIINFSLRSFVTRLMHCSTWKFLILPALIFNADDVINFNSPRTRFIVNLFYLLRCNVACAWNQIYFCLNSEQILYNKYCNFVGIVHLNTTA